MLLLLHALGAILLQVQINVVVLISHPPAGHFLLLLVDFDVIGFCCVNDKGFWRRWLVLFDWLTIQRDIKFHLLHQQVKSVIFLLLL